MYKNEFILDSLKATHKPHAFLSKKKVATSIRISKNIFYFMIAAMSTIGDCQVL